MEPKLVLESLKFIKGKKENNLVVENASHAAPYAEVLFESKVLYDMLHDPKTRLDKVIEQISKKNEAAKQYEKVTGITWPF